MANKRSHADSSNEPPNLEIPRPERNAFAKMMSVPQKRLTYVSQVEDLEVVAIDCYSFSEALEKSLQICHQQSTQLEDEACKNMVERIFIQTTENTVLNHNVATANLKTKLSVLNALIEIATAVAFAPRSAVSNHVRGGRFPLFLIDHMYSILQPLSDLQIKIVVSEKSFVRKVKELRYTTGICWNDQQWKNLEEVLRLVKDLGTIDFRTCYMDACKTLERRHTYQSGGSQTMEESIIKIIRYQITSCISNQSSYEAKYNALNALADIGISLIEEGITGIIWGPLSAGILRVVKNLKEDEKDRIGDNVSPSFLNDFSGSRPEMIVVLRDVINAGAFKSRYSLESYLHLNFYYNSEFDDLIQFFDQVQGKCHARKGNVVMKIVFMRGNKRSKDEWDYTPLDEVLDLFLNTASPLDCNQFLVKVDNKLPEHIYGSDQATEVRNEVYQAILRLSRRIDYRACFETKRNVFRTLAKISLRINSSIQKSKDNRQYYFKTIEWDYRAAETLLVNSMVRICQSLGNAELEKVCGSHIFVHLEISTC